MENKFKSTTILFSLALLFAGIFIGKYLFTPSANSIVINPTKTLMLQTNTPSAHEMVVRFRTTSKLCDPSTLSCPDNIKAGFFELQDSTIYDLVSAVNIIKNRTGTATTPAPTFFRVFFGNEKDGSTKLIVAGLDKSNKELTGNIQIINGKLPCPVLCDINSSDILNGNASTGQSPCR